MSSKKITKIVVSQKEQIERGSRLRLWWESTGWTKSKFAEVAGIHPQHVNNYFSGKLDPINLVESLMNNNSGIDIVWLVDGKVPKQVEDESTKLKIAKLEKELAELRNENNVLRSYIAPSILSLVAEKKMKIRK
jgi:transcriptional regulator with XRE-family HTH domain